MTDPTTSAQAPRRKDTRTRTVLAIALGILVLLLLAATYFLVRVIMPVGGAVEGSTPQGLTWVRSIYGYGNRVEDQLRRPNDVAVAPDGSLWVADGKNNRVVGFNVDGSYRALIHQGPYPGSPNAIVSPSGVDVDEQGLVYIADYGANKVKVYTQDNELVREFEVPLPLDVAVKDDLVVVGSRYGFAIMNPQGEVIEQVGTLGKGDDEFDFVRGVAIGEDDTIYVFDTYNNRVSAYDRKGKRKWIKSTGEPSNAMSATEASKTAGADEGLILPVGLTVDGNGRLVVADAFDFSVTVVDSKNGKVLKKYAKDGKEDGQFAYPTGLDYDAGRDWFAVADTTNDRIQVVRLEGSGGSAVTTLRSGLSGPLRACIAPLVAMIVFLLAALVVRFLRRRKTSGEHPQQVVETE